MNVVIRKALVDLWGRRWQSVLIAVTVGAAAALLYLGLASWQAAADPFDRLLDRTRGSHAYLVVNNTEAGRQVLDRIAAQPDVVQSLRRPAAMVDLDPGQGREKARQLVTAVTPGPQPMMGWVVVEGRDLEPADRDAVLLNVSVARYFGIRPGESVQLSTRTGTRSFKVVGLSTEAVWTQYPLASLQIAYALPETVAELRAEGNQSLEVMGVRLPQPEEASRFLFRAQRNQPGVDQIFVTLTGQETKTGLRYSQGIGVAFLLAFAVMAVLASALITANIVGGAVLTQYREIAVLKVLGFTRAQVLGLFAGQNLVLALVGGAAGIGLGQVTAARVLKAIAENMGAPDLLGFRIGTALIVLGAVLLIALLSAVLAAWRAVVARPVEALRDGFKAPGSRVSPTVRLLTAIRVPVPAILGVKDVISRRTRAFLTVLSLSLCLVAIALTATGGLLIQRMGADVETMGFYSDLVVDPFNLSFAEAQAAVSRLDGVQRFHSGTYAQAVDAQRERAILIYAVGGDWQAFPWRVTEGRRVERPGEVMLAPNLMNNLGVKVGDKLSLEIGGRTGEFTVVGRYLDSMEMGTHLFMTLNDLQQYLPGISEHNLAVRLKPGVDPAEASRALAAATGGKVHVMVIRDMALPPFLKDLLTQSRVLCVLMAAIAVMAVLNTALLTAREQMKEVGIRKSIGMTPSQILGAVAAGGAWLGLIGAVVGVPGGVLLAPALVNGIASGIGIEHLEMGLPLPYVLGLVAGGTVLAAIAALPAAIWAGRLVTARVLSVE